MGRHHPRAGHHTTAPQRQSPAHLEQPPVRTRSTALGRRLRTMRIGEPGRSAPYPCPQRPQPQGKGAPARMGHTDGSTPPQDPRRLPRLPRGHPRRTSHTAITMSTGEPAATESGHGWFGGGPSEKDQVNWHLVGGLPYRMRRSAGGHRKRTRARAGTSPVAYPAGPAGSGNAACEDRRRW